MQFGFQSVLARFGENLFTFFYRIITTIDKNIASVGEFSARDLGKHFLEDRVQILIACLIFWKSMRAEKGRGDRELGKAFSEPRNHLQNFELGLSGKAVAAFDLDRANAVGARFFKAPDRKSFEFSGG